MKHSTIHYSQGVEDWDWPNEVDALFASADADGTVMLDPQAAGEPLGASMTLWSAPMPPHSVENIGEAELRVNVVELKDPAAASARLALSTAPSARAT
jgi:hypothetical protein